MGTSHLQPMEFAFFAFNTVPHARTILFDRGANAIDLATRGLDGRYGRKRQVDHLPGHR